MWSSFYIGDTKMKIITEEDLEEGEVVCSVCNGKGSIWSERFQDAAYTCEKCLGTGYLDWIENVVGKLRNDFFKIDPQDAVDFYYNGNKILETTPHDGGIIFHGRKYQPTGTSGLQ
jgi:hypothetical protein